jgi:hypothetical protein
MNSGRNLLLLRSMGFGALTKASGAAVVFVGIPVISKALSLGDYGRFLTAMALASAVLMCFGAATAVSIRQISHAKFDAHDDVDASTGETMGLFIALFLATVCIALSAYLVLAAAQKSPSTYLLLTTLAVAAQGLFMWGDSYRIATRTDHVSNVIQFCANLGLIACLIAARRTTLFYSTLVYFGVPLIAQVVITAQVLMALRRKAAPAFSTSHLRASAAQLAAVFSNILSDYFKIFLPGLLLASNALLSEQTKYATLLLLVARLVNPISLITRPLMPAYINARVERDRDWLRKSRAVLLIFPLAIAFVVLAASSVVPTNSIGWFMPALDQPVTRAEIVLTALFLCSHGYSALSAPMFLASQDTAGRLASRNIAITGISLAAGASLLHAFGGLAIYTCISLGSGLLAALAAKDIARVLFVESL